MSATTPLLIADLVELTGSLGVASESLGVLSVSFHAAPLQTVYYDSLGMSNEKSFVYALRR